MRASVDECAPLLTMEEGGGRGAEGWRRDEGEEEEEEEADDRQLASEADDMQLGIALSRSLQHAPPVDEREATNEKRRKARRQQQQPPPPPPVHPAAVAAGPSSAGIPPSDPPGAAEPALERCGICLGDDGDVDGEEMGGWGRTRCCSGLFHYNCLSTWTRSAVRGETVESTRGPTALPTSCPYCRKELPKTNSRMMERV